MGKNENLDLNLECEVLVYMEKGMLMVALHNYFPLESDL